MKSKAEGGNYSRLSRFKAEIKIDLLWTLEHLYPPRLAIGTCGTTLTFVLILLLGNFQQILSELVDDLLFLHLLSGQNGVEISLEKQKWTIQVSNEFNDPVYSKTETQTDQQLLDLYCSME